MCTRLDASSTASYNLEQMFGLYSSNTALIWTVAEAEKFTYTPTDSVQYMYRHSIEPAVVTM